MYLCTKLKNNNMVQDFMKYEIGKPRDSRFVKMIVDEYNSTNISLQDLSKKYHTDALHQFKLYNIPIRSKGEQRALTRKGCISLGWIGKSIETEEQAYICGLLLADGYVSDTQVGLRLKESDKALVEKVKNYFSTEIQLQKGNNCFLFVVSSKQLCHNLMNLGVIKGKTHHELNIPEMKPGLIRHFIRGFFDGDGSVFLNKNGIYNSLRCNICSPTEKILSEIHNIFIHNNIKSTINKENRIGKFTTFNGKDKIVCTSDMYRLFIRSKKAVAAFYHFLYDDSTIYLERKKTIFDDNMNLLVYQKSKKIYANTELTNQISQG